MKRIKKIWLNAGLTVTAAGLVGTLVGCSCHPDTPQPETTTITYNGEKSLDTPKGEKKVVFVFDTSAPVEATDIITVSGEAEQGSTKGCNVRLTVNRAQSTGKCKIYVNAAINYTDVMVVPNEGDCVVFSPTIVWARKDESVSQKFEGLKVVYRSNIKDVKLATNPSLVTYPASSYRYFAFNLNGTTVPENSQIRVQVELLDKTERVNGIENNTTTEEPKYYVDKDAGRLYVAFNLLHNQDLQEGDYAKFKLNLYCVGLETSGITVYWESAIAEELTLSYISTKIHIPSYELEGTRVDHYAGAVTQTYTFLHALDLNPDYLTITAAPSESNDVTISCSLDKTEHEFEGYHYWIIELTFNGLDTTKDQTINFNINVSHPQFSEPAIYPGKFEYVTPKLILKSDPLLVTQMDKMNGDNDLSPIEFTVSDITETTRFTYDVINSSSSTEGVVAAGSGEIEIQSGSLTTSVPTNNITLSKAGKIADHGDSATFDLRIASTELEPSKQWVEKVSGFSLTQQLSCEIEKSEVDAEIDSNHFDYYVDLYEDYTDVKAVVTLDTSKSKGIEKISYSSSKVGNKLHVLVDATLTKPELEDVVLVTNIEIQGKETIHQQTKEWSKNFNGCIGNFNRTITYAGDAEVKTDVGIWKTNLKYLLLSPQSSYSGCTLNWEIILDTCSQDTIIKDKKGSIEQLGKNVELPVELINTKSGFLAANDFVTIKQVKFTLIDSQKQMRWEKTLTDSVKVSYTGAIKVLPDEKRKLNPVAGETTALLTLETQQMPYTALTQCVVNQTGSRQSLLATATTPTVTAGKINTVIEIISIDTLTEGDYVDFDIAFDVTGTSFKERSKDFRITFTSEQAWVVTSAKAQEATTIDQSNPKISSDAMLPIQLKTPIVANQTFELTFNTKEQSSADIVLHNKTAQYVTGQSTIFVPLYLENIVNPITFGSYVVADLSLVSKVNGTIKWTQSITDISLALTNSIAPINPDEGTKTYYTKQGTRDGVFEFKLAHKVSDDYTLSVSSTACKGINVTLGSTKPIIDPKDQTHVSINATFANVPLVDGDTGTLGIIFTWTNMNDPSQTFTKTVSDVTLKYYGTLQMGPTQSKHTYITAPDAASGYKFVLDHDLDEGQTLTAEVTRTGGTSGISPVVGDIAKDSKNVTIPVSLSPTSAVSVDSYASFKLTVKCNKGTELVWSTSFEQLVVQYVGTVSILSNPIAIIDPNITPQSVGYDFILSSGYQTGDVFRVTATKTGASSADLDISLDEQPVPSSDGKFTAKINVNKNALKDGGWVKFTINVHFERGADIKWDRAFNCEITATNDIQIISERHVKIDETSESTSPEGTWRCSLGSYPEQGQKIYVQVTEQKQTYGFFAGTEYGASVKAQENAITPKIEPATGDVYADFNVAYVTGLLYGDKTYDNNTNVEFNVKFTCVDADGKLVWESSAPQKLSLEYSYSTFEWIEGKGETITLTGKKDPVPTTFLFTIRDFPMAEITQDDICLIRVRDGTYELIDSTYAIPEIHWGTTEEGEIQLQLTVFWQPREQITSEDVRFYFGIRVLDFVYTDTNTWYLCPTVIQVSIK